MPDLNRRWYLPAGRQLPTIGWATNNCRKDQYHELT